jgi:hypothetical protein
MHESNAWGGPRDDIAIKFQVQLKTALGNWVEFTEV